MSRQASTLRLNGQLEHPTVTIVHKTMPLTDHSKRVFSMYAVSAPVGTKSPRWGIMAIHGGTPVSLGV